MMVREDTNHGYLIFQLGQCFFLRILTVPFKERLLVENNSYRFTPSVMIMSAVLGGMEPMVSANKLTS
jgi:hypothetical protein